MRVLHVISSLEIGGAQRLLSDLLPIQKKLGMDVSLLVLKWEDNTFTEKLKDARVPILSLNAKSFRNPILALTVRRFIKEYDVVHAHLVHALYICSIAARGLKTKLVYTEHSTLNNRRGKSFFRPIEKFIYGRYDKLISISQQTQDALQDWLQSTSDRFVVINNGVDTKAFASIRRVVIPKSLIMVSRFVASKDQDTVIRAMRKLDEDITLRLVGDGENLEHCRQVAKECGVEARVYFLGERADVADLIAESYIGIQSSNWEGFGLTAVELMACGKPVIATDVDGLKQVVEGAGILFHRGDIVGLAKIVNNLLNDDTKYNTCAKLCVQRAANYDINVMSNKYINVYKRLY